VYKYTVTLKPIDDGVDRGSNPRTSTISTFAECAYDGGDMGIDTRKGESGVTGM